MLDVIYDNDVFVMMLDVMIYDDDDVFVMMFDIIKVI